MRTSVVGRTYCKELAWDSRRSWSVTHTITDWALPVAFVTEPSDSDAGLLAAHYKVTGGKISIIHREKVRARTDDGATLCRWELVNGFHRKEERETKTRRQVGWDVAVNM